MSVRAVYCAWSFEYALIFQVPWCRLGDLVSKRERKREIQTYDNNASGSVSPSCEMYVIFSSDAWSQDTEESFFFFVWYVYSCQQIVHIDSSISMAKLRHVVEALCMSENVLQNIHQYRYVCFGTDFETFPVEVQIPKTIIIFERSFSSSHFVEFTLLNGAKRAVTATFPYL